MQTIFQLHSERASVLDRLHEGQVSILTQIVAVVAFALLTVLGAKVRIYLWEVPITLQTVAVYGSGLFLGWRNGFLAQLLYLTLGLFFPIFAGEGYGPAYLFGAITAGYLLAYPFAAALIGWLTRKWNTLLGSTLALFLGSQLLLLIGTMWLYTMSSLDWSTALVHGWLRFVPIELAKIFLLGAVYSGVRYIR